MSWPAQLLFEPEHSCVRMLLSWPARILFEPEDSATWAVVSACMLFDEPECSRTRTLLTWPAWMLLEPEYSCAWTLSSWRSFASVSPSRWRLAKRSCRQPLKHRGCGLDACAHSCGCLPMRMNPQNAVVLQFIQAALVLHQGGQVPVEWPCDDAGCSCLRSLPFKIELLIAVFCVLLPSSGRPLLQTCKILTSCK